MNLSILFNGELFESNTKARFGDYRYFDELWSDEIASIILTLIVLVRKKRKVRTTYFDSQGPFNN